MEILKRILLLLCFSNSLSGQSTKDSIYNLSRSEKAFFNDTIPQRICKDYHHKTNTIFSIDFDQDWLLEIFKMQKLNEDRNYTMGLGFSLVNPNLSKSLIFDPLIWINKKMSLNDKLTTDESSIMFGCTGFTPDSLPATYIINNDRPYASLLFFQTSISGLNNDNNTFWRTDFIYGVIGTNIGKATQTFIHETMNNNDTQAPRTPRGWSHQISNSGEPTLLYSVTKKKLLYDKYNCCRYGLQLFEEWNLYAGYYTGASFGMGFRIGLIDPSRWAEGASPFDNSDKLFPGKKTLIDNTLGELYYFAIVKPYFNIYNSLLSGQFEKSDYVVPWQNALMPVLTFKTGIAFKFPCSNFGLKICIISGRTPEFHQPDRNTRSHFWGSLYLTL